MYDPNQPVIQTHGLSKMYGEVPALKSLDLSVSRHSIFGFLGPNGAGKTTTMKVLLGLTRPTTGSAQVLGYDTARDSVTIRHHIGYLPQQPTFYKHMTARETLRFTASFFYRGSRKQVEARVNELLELAGLEGKADRPVGKFSGGERQRLGIAQAQVNDPELLILDEPAAALDPIGRFEVLQVMERLQKHTTIFYSTHILDDVQQVSDTVAILNHGRLIAQGPVEALLHSGDRVVYTVGLRGDIESAQRRVSAQPWVTGIQASVRNGATQWQVDVSDESAAESQLLRVLLADPEVTVTAFNRKAYELEEVFMDIVIGDNNDNRS